MNKNKKIAYIIICLLFVGVIVSMITRINNKKSEDRTPIVPSINKKLIGAAAYSCDDGKTIEASYYEGQNDVVATTTIPNQPPIPTGSASLDLSDGRLLDLAHAISADGARYVNEDESIVFWSRGDGAFITENGKQTYSNCTRINDNDKPGNKNPEMM